MHRHGFTSTSRRRPSPSRVARRRCRRRIRLALRGRTRRKVPGGLLHCHTLKDGPRRADRTSWVSALDQVCVDIPPSLWNREVAYWQTITGRRLEPGRRPEFASLNDPDPAGGLRVLLQRLDSGDRVSAYPDFAVADRAAETARHTALGATTIGTMDWWTVMRSPDGLTYCLTERDPLTGRAQS